MKKQEKLQLLRKFKEKPLIDNVIIPLLEKMGFKNITVTHGSLEKGKDLLFYKENEFEEREYTGVQVKAVDIHGRAGEKGNATEILNQAQQAFRIAGYHDELYGFTRLEVLEFDDLQIKRFINNWFGESQQKKAQSMLKAVMENKNIKTLARNPLMVAIIAIIYEEDRELPQRRADLYKRAVDVLLSRWDLRKKLKNRFKTDQKEFILRKLAFRCHCRNLRVTRGRSLEGSCQEGRAIFFIFFAGLYILQTQQRFAPLIS